MQRVLYIHKHAVREDDLLNFQLFEIGRIKKACDIIDRWLLDADTTLETRIIIQNFALFLFSRKE